MEQLTKLHPIAICSVTSSRAPGAALVGHRQAVTVSGSWRQQFDWAAIEWNRDNVFEHPLLRNRGRRPGGLVLSMRDARTASRWILSCSRRWTGPPRLGAEQRVEYRVRLKDYAISVAGSYGSATLQLELQGTLTTGDYIELAWISTSTINRSGRHAGERGRR